MTKANTTVVAKLGVAFVAVAMLLTMVTPAKAATIEELQAMIAQLTAQLAALSGGSTTASETYNFTRSLTVGAEGADVTALQNYLIGEGHSIPAGATGYFGAQTTAAVAAWQAANGVAPAVGYFGPISIAKYNALMATTETETEGGDDSASVELSGEAALVTVDMKDGDDADNVMEGGSDVMVAETDIEFANGDARITRIDYSFVGASTPTEDDPWDAFDAVSLYVNGDKVAEMNVDDEDDWLNEDAGTLRISGLNIVAEEDEEITVVLAIDVASSVEDAGTDADWTVSIDSMRFEDGDGVVTTEDDFQDLYGDSNGTRASFSITEEGADDALEISSSSSDPDATIFEVDEDNTSDWYEVLVFDVEAGEDGGDITIDTITATTTIGTANYEDVVDEIKLVIDGNEYDDVTVTGEDATVSTLSFDLDEDVTIDAGDEVEVSVMVKFLKTDDGSNYANGETFQVSVNSTGWEAEGADDLAAGAIDGSATGETHTLQAEGIVAELDSITEDKDAAGFSGDEDTGTYVFTYEVTATGADFYFDEDTATLDFDVYEGNSTTSSSTAVLDIAGADDASTSDFVLYEGETATFTLTVETTTGISGAVKVDLNSMTYSAADDGSGELTHTFIPAKDWVSDSLILN